MNNYFLTFTKDQQKNISKKRGFVKIKAESKAVAIQVAGALYPSGHSGIFLEKDFITQPYQVLLETVNQISR